VTEANQPGPADAVDDTTASAAPEGTASTDGAAEEQAGGSAPDPADAAGQGPEAADQADQADQAEPSDVPEDPAEPDFQSKIDELTTDLQRLQAEYLNYKRRVERDRELIRENATYAALSPIIEVLDTIDRAREHEPLEGGFKAVAEQLESVVAGLGLKKFGEPGDVFDPTIHEALSHMGTDPDVSEVTCKVVAKAGYKIGDRVVRAAQVLVVDPQ